MFRFSRREYGEPRRCRRLDGRRNWPRPLTRRNVARRSTLRRRSRRRDRDATRNRALSSRRHRASLSAGKRIEIPAVQATATSIVTDAAEPKSRHQPPPRWFWGSAQNRKVRNHRHETFATLVRLRPAGRHFHYQVGTSRRIPSRRHRRPDALRRLSARELRIEKRFFSAGRAGAANPLGRSPQT